MKKRVLALLLSGVMATSLLVGCGSANNNESAGNSESAGKSEAAGSSEENAEKELTTVTILAANFQNGNVNKDSSQWEEYPVSQVIIQDLEEIGIRLELELLDADGFASSVKARIAAGTNLPDMIAYSYWDCNQTDVIEWVEAGLVYSVDDLLEQYDEDGSIKAWYDEQVPGLWGMSTLADGKNYWFANGTGPGPKYDANTGDVYTWVLNAPATSVREDWVKAVGEDVKDVYSLEEISTLLKKMYDEDANGNGAKDEVLYLNPESFGNSIAAAYGLNFSLLAGCYEEDGVMFSNFYHENFPAYVEYLNDLYEYGVLDTKALSVSPEEMTGANVVSMHSTTYAINGWETYLTGDEDAYYAPAIVDLDGNMDNGFTTFVDNYKGSSQGACFIPKSNENPEPVIRLLDYVFTEKYQVLNMYGREDVNYEIIDGGWRLCDWANTDTTLENSRFILTGVGFFALPRVIADSYAVKNDYGDLTDPARRKDYWAYEVYAKECFPKAEHVVLNSDIASITTDEEQETLNEITNTLETYAKELLVDLILGNKSLDDLATYQAELEKLGLQDYIDVKQARRNRAFGE